MRVLLWIGVLPFILVLTGCGERYSATERAEARGAEQMLAVVMVINAAQKVAAEEAKTKKNINPSCKE